MATPTGRSGGYKTPLSQRPRAPSPPSSPTGANNFNILRRQQEQVGGRLCRNIDYNINGVKRDDFDTDSNTYSTLDDFDRPKNVIPLPPKTRIDRMFGDSVCPSEESGAESVMNMSVLMNSVNKSLTGSSNRNGSVSSNASSSTMSSQRGGSLANIYQARKNSINYDAATVNQIKNQFQAQIESMLQSQAKNKPMKSGHIQSTSERELNEIRELQRGKSFDEARNAVQQQIEKMFSNTQLAAQATNVPANPVNPKPGPSSAISKSIEALASSPVGRLLQNPHNGGLNKGVKHTMHGVSHALPGELDDDIRPPPVHYGVDQAIKSGSSHLLNSRKTFSSTDDLSATTPPLQNGRLVSSHESLLDPVSPHLSARLTPPASFSNSISSGGSKAPLVKQNSSNPLGNINVNPPSSSAPKPPSGNRRHATFGKLMQLSWYFAIRDEISIFFSKLFLV